MRAKPIFFLLLIGSLVLLSGVARWYGKQPNGILFMQAQSHVATTDSALCLTFDDGPSAHLTPLLLDLLKKHQVKAVFFVNGIQIEANPQIGQRIIAEGHQMGNHTYQHDPMVWRSKDQIRTDLLKTDQLIRTAGGKDQHLFRAPYGDSFLNLPLVLKQLNKQYIGWSVEPKAQYETPFSAPKVIQQTLEQLHPGAILLLHDGWHPETAAFLQAVEQIILQAQQSGYHFTAL
ncbi:MAG: polysaccharide deacetylase family protein [Bacteroidota bacterium]